MRVLVACEFSGVVRDAFIAKGHDAISCDLLPTESEGPHYQGDVFNIIDDGFDLMIAHPPCTYLCNSGVRWLHTQEGRRMKMFDGAVFFRQLLNADIPKVCIENPVMHRYAKAIVGQNFTMSCQPWEHGDGEVKRTCLWLRGLEPFGPTNIVDGREAKVHKASPGPDRWRLRSVTYPGIAKAMAEAWG